MGGPGLHLVAGACIWSLKGLVLRKSPWIHREVEALTTGLLQPCRGFLPALPHLGWPVTGPPLYIFCRPTVCLGKVLGVVQPLPGGITGSVIHLLGCTPWLWRLRDGEE